MNEKINYPITTGKPKWLRKKLPVGGNYQHVRELVKQNNLTTVCREAQCPNQFECYSRGAATFMILGDKCTRNCSFCAVGHGPDHPPDEDEPARVAQAVMAMGLKYAVITSVTRDDLADGGASFFAETIKEIRKHSHGTLIEVLIPDLQANWDALSLIAEARPDVLNHNIETVERLYPEVRPEAIYQRSLDLLAEVKSRAPRMITKSGLMLGLGEYEEEVFLTLKDLRHSRCDILTLGQYLQPSKRHLPVKEWIPPERFAFWEETALKHGFAGVAAGPSVRSSYEAEQLYRNVKEKNTLSI